MSGKLLSAGQFQTRLPANIAVAIEGDYETPRSDWRNIAISLKIPLCGSKRVTA
jgi:hypothetical protein